MNIIALITYLSILGTTVSIDSGDLMYSSCGKHNTEIAGCFRKDNVIVINSEYYSDWKNILVHEFSHAYSYNKLGLSNRYIYFKNEEEMSLEYEKYFSDPKSYSVNKPIQYLFFKQNYPNFENVVK